GDQVIVGNPLPGPGPVRRTLSDIHGSLLIQSFQALADQPLASLVLDDSGDQTGRTAVLGNDGVAWGISGLAPGTIYDWGLAPSTPVTILGGAGNDNVDVRGMPAVSVKADGGGGVNTLQGPDTANAWQVTGAN